MPSGACSTTPSLPPRWIEDPSKEISHSLVPAEHTSSSEKSSYRARILRRGIVLTSLTRLGFVALGE